MAAQSSIRTTSSFLLVQCLTVILFFALPCFAADPEPLQDFCVADLKATTIVNGFPCKPVSQVTSNDFYYSGLKNESSIMDPFGIGASFADVTTFPGLNTLGLSMARGDIAPGGIAPFHVHPRATELDFVLKGEVILGFISTTDVVYSKVVKAGELFVVPRGLVHFLKNVGSEKAVVIAIFDSQLPGAALVPTNLFGSKPEISNNILAKNFQVSEVVIALIKSKFGN